MAIESVTIYRRSVNYWEIIDNTSPEPNGEDAYRGRLLYDGTVTISGANGTVLYNRVPWQAFEYIDEYGSNSFTPTSASDLMQNLINEGFFLAGSSEGGEGATTFLELTDTFPNYFGREGQVVQVNEDGTGLTSVPIEVLESPNLQQVTDSGSQTDNPIIVKSEDETRNISYEEDRIVYTNTGGISRITFDEPVAEVSYEVPAKETDDTFAMLSDIAPIVTGLAKWIGKGWVGTTANILATQEIGDIFQGSFFDIGENKWYWYPALQWLGGDLDDLSNFNWSYRDDFAFTV